MRVDELPPASELHARAHGDPGLGAQLLGSAGRGGHPAPRRARGRFRAGHRSPRRRAALQRVRAGGGSGAGGAARRRAPALPDPRHARGLRGRRRRGAITARPAASPPTWPRPSARAAVSPFATRNNFQAESSRGASCSANLAIARSLIRSRWLPGIRSIVDAARRDSGPIGLELRGAILGREEQDPPGIHRRNVGAHGAAVDAPEHDLLQIGRTQARRQRTAKRPEEHRREPEQVDANALPERTPAPGAPETLPSAEPWPRLQPELRRIEEREQAHLLAFGEQLPSHLERDQAAHGVSDQRIGTRALLAPEAREIARGDAARPASRDGFRRSPARG